MTDINITTRTLHAHEAGGAAILEGLAEFVEHLAVHTELPTDTVLVLNGGSFQARFKVIDRGTHREVEILDFTDLH